MTFALDATPLTIPTGGVTRYTECLTRALAGRYPEDRFLLLTDQALETNIRFPSNVLLHSGAPSGTGLVDRRWWLLGLPRALRKLGVDVFHGTDFAVPYVPVKPSVMTVHDLSPWLHPEWQPDARRVRRRTPILLRLGAATMTITPSDTIRRAAIERFGLKVDRVVAIPLAASDLFRPARERSPLAPMRPYFLYVGTLEPRKNVHRIIDAWRALRLADPRFADLVLAGRTRADVEAPKSEPGLHLLGALPDDQLPALYSHAVAVLYPSLYEGFGLPVLEAMQCGALVIASKDPAIVEVTGGLAERAAFHIEAVKSEEIAGAMKVAMVPGPMTAFIRERALRRAAEFTWEKTAEKTREVYEEARRVFSHA